MTEDIAHLLYFAGNTIFGASELPCKNQFELSVNQFVLPVSSPQSSRIRRRSS